MKVWNYFYIGLTMMILLIVFGIFPVSDFLGWIGITRVGDDISFSFANMSAKFLLVLGGAAAAGIAIGFLTKSKSENYVLIPIIIVLLGLVGTFISIMSASAGYPPFMKTIISIIFVPFIAGYLLALAEWFRGTD